MASNVATPLADNHPGTSVVKDSNQKNTDFDKCESKLFVPTYCHESLYWSCYLLIAGLLGFTHFCPLPVLLQMILYTAPILYIGSHLSLQQKEIDPDTGKKNLKAESMTKNDAMLFPFIGSIALLALYLAYKFLPSYWVNLLITTYLTFFGCAALGETLFGIMVKVSYGSNKPWLSIDYTCSSKLGAWIGPVAFQASKERIISYSIGLSVGIFWMVTRHWIFHNLFAIAFCVQGIRMVSVGSFKIATILLCGLFIYDIFWVFGTDVMVTVAKSFEAPAKIIFPVSYNPWKQSILGLGDIVIPGIFIAMILRFDHHRHEQNIQAASDSLKSPKFNIHQSFSKSYFLWNLLSYELGLLTTGIVMLTYKHAQPALLYLVPYCLLGLLIPAWFNGHLPDVFNYTEEEEEEEKKDEIELKKDN